MLRAEPADRWGRRLVEKVTCPNCWHVFAPEEVLSIAKHQELLGDPVAGPDEFLRFLPSRFSPKGEAIDANGFITFELACPRCHLRISEAMLEVPPFFISVVGSPASGKSYLLTTMSWSLRHLMPQACVSFSDLEPEANGPIREYEQTLFLNSFPDRPTEIRKTQRDDRRLHRTAILSSVPMRFPTPLEFLMWPTAGHPGFVFAHKIGRIVVLYDNAGEDFLPGADNNSSAAAEHLSRSQIIMSLFDPTQDPRFSTACVSDDPQLSHGQRPGSQGAVVMRQETILREAMVRVRRHRGLAQDAKVRTPLIVVVPKFDIWTKTTGIFIDREPYATASGGLLKMDLAAVESTSGRLRDFIAGIAPEFVATAEGFSERVLYIPVSSFGRSPEIVRRDGARFYGIRPRDVSPKWTTVPLLYCLAKWAKGLIGTVDSAADGGR